MGLGGRRADGAFVPPAVWLLLPHALRAASQGMPDGGVVSSAWCGKVTGPASWPAAGTFRQGCSRQDCRLVGDRRASRAIWALLLRRLTGLHWRVADRVYTCPGVAVK